MSEENQDKMSEENQDKTLKCEQCGNDFIHGLRDQEFYKEKGYQNMPKRCPDCRRERRQARRLRQMHTITCSECGAEDQVPFEPNTDKPVYCNECFQKHRQPREE